MRDPVRVQIQLTHGPEGRPLITDCSLAEAGLFGRFAYHGIPSCGLDARMDRLDAETRDAWPNVAAPLEDLLCGRLREATVRDSSLPIARALLTWHELAAECGVRSLRTSAMTAYEAARRLVAGELGSPAVPADRKLELRWLKEGRTSSVWRLASRETGNWGVCINIARDRVADDELLITTAQLERWGQTDDDICRTLWRGAMPIASDAGTDRVNVAISEWIDGAELHLASRPERLAAIHSFVLVDRSDGGPPDQRACGSWLSDDDTRRIAMQYLGFLKRHVTSIDAKTVRVPRLEINDGDLVWTGDRIVIVAASIDEVWTRQRWLDEVIRLESANSTAVFGTAAGGGQSPGTR